MSIGKFAAERPVTLSMTAVAVVIFGLVALGRLPVSLLPKVSYPTLTVEARMAGAAPLEVENLLAKPMEEAVGVVSGVERITSVSKPGLARVTLEFGWDRDMDVAALDVRQKLDMVTLPEDSARPRVLRYDPSEDPILRVGVIGTKNLARLRYYADEVLKRRLESVEGVAAVKVVGGDVSEIVVEVDEGRLREAGLTQTDVARAIRQSNVNAAGGSLYEEEARYLVRTANEFDSIEDVASTIVYSDGTRRVVLGDVAEVKRGIADRDVLTRIGGHEAVELQVFQEGDANAVRVAERFHAALEGASKALPPEVRTVVLFDQSRFINAAIGEVRGNAIVGALIAFAVLLLFLRDLRSTLIVGVSIPISVIATFFVMHQLGVTLNVMSLGGLALGVGMLVDNAIVVLEAIVRRREAGASALDAAIAGSGEIGMAVTASTLTTVVVFLPVIFIDGIAAQLFRDQALTVTGSLVASLVVSLTLIPMLAARVRRSAETDGEQRRFAFRATAAIVRGFRHIALGARLLLGFVCWPIDALFRRVWARIERTYPIVLRQGLSFPWMVVLAGLGFTGLSLMVVREVPLELIPPMHQGEFLIDVVAPDGTSLDHTARMIADLEQQLAATPLVGSVFTTVGADAERSGGGAAGSGSNEAQIHVVLQDRASRSAEAQVLALARDVLANMAGVSYRFDRPGSFSARSPLEVEIYGDDVAALSQVAQDLAHRMAGLGFLSDVDTDAANGNPEIQIHFDRDRLATLGVDANAVATALRAKLEGEVATRIVEADRDIDVRVRAADLRQSSLEALERTTVATSAGAPVALGSVATVTLGTGPSEIRRIGQRRAAVIRASLAGIDLGAATTRLQETLRSVPLPSGVQPPELSGQSKELEHSVRQLGFALLLAIFLVYFVMASQFESLRHPFLILFAVPMAVGGSLVSLWVTGQPLSIVAIIGIVLLAGIAVNNGIVLIDCINQLRRGGVALRESIVEAGSLRLRPIFMTTSTTVLGLLPMALGIGDGAELRVPLAVAVMGGLVVATALTLLVIPAAYLLLERRGERATVAALAPLQAGELA